MGGRPQELHLGAEGAHRGQGVRLCSDKRLGCPLLLVGGFDWLVCITSWAARVVNSMMLKTSGVQLGELAEWGALLAGWGAYPERAAPFSLALPGPGPISGHFHNSR